MANLYYIPSVVAVPATTVRSNQFNDNNNQISQGFDLLPTPTEIFGGTVNFGVSTGTDANIYLASIQPDNITSYFDGLTFQIRAHQDNTGAVQVNVNDLGLRQVVTVDGDQLAAGDVVTNNVMVIRYNATSTQFTLETALTTINNAANRAASSATAAAENATNAAISETAAANSAADAAISAASASTDAGRAETAADIVGGTLLLETLLWTQGTTATEPLRRYLFEGNLYVAPTASPDEPVSLGPTPVGDVNWVSWSDPVRFFAYEETTTAPKTVFDLGTTFSNIADVFVDTNLQSTSSYTTDGVAGTLTFNEPVPQGIYVKIWVGRIRDALIEEFESIADDAEASATAAAGSATAAATSATASAGSATDSATSATNAATSESNAETSENNAATSETNAGNSATAAAGSASAANTSATNASNSASAAATSASNAATSESNADTSETNAGNSATAAASSASAANTSATNAENSASAAASSATAASNSASAAATSESNADTSETNAGNSATAAANSASSASTSATNAANSASAAASSATSAANSATEVANNLTNISVITTYDAGTIATPTSIFRPGSAFSAADIAVGGVPQRPGAGNSYVIETDSNNGNFNQIRFNTPIPAGLPLYGTLIGSL